MNFEQYYFDFKDTGKNSIIDAGVFGIKILTSCRIYDEIDYLVSGNPGSFKLFNSEKKISTPGGCVITIKSYVVRRSSLLVVEHDPSIIEESKGRREYHTIYEAKTASGLSLTEAFNILEWRCNLALFKAS